MKKILFISIIFLSMMTSAEAQCPEIRPDHPRIFFNAETWPSIKERALTDKKKYLDELLKEVDMLPEEPEIPDTRLPEIKDRTIPIDPVKEYGREAAACALAWRFTGNEKYLEKARKMLKISVDSYTDATRNLRPVNWYCHTRINAMCAYDWIFEALTPEERKDLIVPLVEHVEVVQPEYGLQIPRNRGGDIDTGFYGTRAMFWYSGLAAYGDGYCDSLAARHLKVGYDWFRRVLDNRNKTAGDDGALISAVPGYAAVHYPYAQFNFLFSMISSTGQNLSSEYPMLPYYANWLWWVWIRDSEKPKALRHAGYGDSHHKFNQDPSSGIYEQMAQFLHLYKDMDEDSKGIISAIRDFSTDQYRIRGDMYPVLPFIVDEGPDAEEKYVSIMTESPVKARHFENLGQIYMRSGFTPDATYCTFTSGAERITGHKHFDENNFTIYKHDHLALDTGCRALATDYNIIYYYCQSVAHNVVLIHKPQERMSGHWGIKRKDHDQVYNYGGMTRKIGGEVKAFETNDTFTYIASDATVCYGMKCKEAVRQFVFLYPDYIIVYDRVTSANPSYRKEWLLHTQNKPEMKGNVVMADSRQGRLFCQTLLPEDAELGLVGGKDKEFLVGDMNYALADNYVEEVRKIAEQTSNGPYWGEWRLEVKPSQERAEDRFLHVLTAGDTRLKKPVKAQYIRDGEKDGVQLKVDGRRVTFWFNCAGAIGGEVEYDGEKRPLAENVQPQSGFEF